MIYIIRHGQTELNQRQVLQGRSDHPLNEDGIKQAQDAAAALSGLFFDHVFTSPLKRAVQTAQIVAPDVEPVIDDRLIEMDYGPYEGADLKALPPEVLTFFGDFVHNPAPAGMEPLNSVVDRAGSFLEDVKNLHGNILISTHAIAMKGMIYGWLGSKAVLKVSDWLHSGLYTPVDFKKFSEYASEIQGELGMESQSNENSILNKVDITDEAVVKYNNVIRGNAEEFVIHPI